MHHPRTSHRWVQVVAAATVTLGLVPLGQAAVTATATPDFHGTYTLQATTTGAPCDAWEWRVLAGLGAEIEHPDEPNTQARLGLGLYLLEAVCIRYTEDGEQRESSPVAIDTRPKYPDPQDFAQVVFEIPDLCLTCGLWTDPLQESLLDLSLVGTFHSELDPDPQPLLYDVVGQYGFDPTPTPVIPDDLQALYGLAETVLVAPDGFEVGFGMASYAMMHDGEFRITTGVFNETDKGIVAGAFLEALDPTPQPS